MTQNIAKTAEHARIAARHAIMKGASRSDAGVCFMAEGLVQLYKISPEHAARLVQSLLPHVHDLIEGTYSGTSNAV